MLFVTVIIRYIKCPQDTQRKTGPSLTEGCWNVHKNYWDAHFTLVVCNNRIGINVLAFALDYLRRRLTCVKFIQTIATAFQRKRKSNTYDTCSCWFPTEYTENRKWKCHNCSCVTTTSDNLLRYRTGIDAVPSENPRSVFWRWIGYWPLLTEGMSVSKLPSATPS